MENMGTNNKTKQHTEKRWNNRNQVSHERFVVLPGGDLTITEITG